MSRLVWWPCMAHRGSWSRRGAGRPLTRIGKSTRTSSQQAGCVWPLAGQQRRIAVARVADGRTLVGTLRWLAGTARDGGRFVVGSHHRRAFDVGCTSPARIANASSALPAVNTSNSSSRVCRRASRGRTSCSTTRAFGQRAHYAAASRAATKLRLRCTARWRGVHECGTLVTKL